MNRVPRRKKSLVLRLKKVPRREEPKALLVLKVRQVQKAHQVMK